MAGTLRHSFAERLLSRKDYSELGIGRSGVGDDAPRSRSVREKFNALCTNVRESSIKAYEMGRSDPRKVVFAAKMGLALALVSILIFFKEPLKEMSQYSIWAILTVVVVFEFSIGATLNKGFNRALGTLSAGALALGIAELTELAGEYQEVFIVFSIFGAGKVQAVKSINPHLWISTLTVVNSIQTDAPYWGCRLSCKLFETVPGNEAIRIRIPGVFVDLLYCAGEDLHKLVVKNFKGVATSLEGCVNEYLENVKYERIPSKILTFQASDDPTYSGYRSAVESTSQEDSLLDFALWEPPHGRFKMWNYPWRDYVKVSGALRHCAFMVMAMHGCILSEIQAPFELRQVFRKELQRVGSEGAHILRELANKVEKMEKLSHGDILHEVHEAAEELQMMIDQKSYLLVNSVNWEAVKRHKDFEDSNALLEVKDHENKQRVIHSLSELSLNARSASTLRHFDPQNPNISINPSVQWGSTGEMLKDQVTWPSRLSILGDTILNEREVRTYESASALSFATFTSLLMEFVARLQNIVNSFERLSEKAKFQEPIDPPMFVEVDGFWTKLLKCIGIKD
ncbi:hypothetical protein RHSIM_Rhsim03G0219400 [Rhododendron simsii]|uniref:Uncharacterized protein n=1 Tax=Rhododendron simsii TaxID=118357 RepID=A0A834LV23_RHOSS|nr:hypothetical protein RHSIM_Rhsim03G0219400 [Rhododendron simsii]